MAGWEITFEKEDGAQVKVRLGQLPPSVFAKIAKESDAGLTYKGVELFPKEDPSILYKVICAAAEFAGVDPPAEPESMDEDDVLRAMFGEIPDVSELPAVDGFLAEVPETASGSSSGPPSDSTGLEP